MTAALPLINQRLEDARKSIDADLFHWLSGKKHPDLEHSGSLAMNYWGPYLDGHARQLTDLAFVAAKELSDEHGLDPYDTVEDAWNGAESAVNQIIDRMRDYDRKMRGKGFPDSVPQKDVMEIRERHSAAIRKRAENERALMSERKKTDIVLTSEHGFLWFVFNCHWSARLWMIGSAAAAAWALLSFGVTLGRNQTFQKVQDALQSSQQSPPTSPPTIPQNTATPKL